MRSTRDTSPEPDRPRWWPDHLFYFPVGYAPIDCPVCGRRRVEYGNSEAGRLVYLRCEKCGANSEDGFGGPAT